MITSNDLGDNRHWPHLSHIGGGWVADPNRPVTFWDRNLIFEPVREHQWDNNGCPVCAGCLYKDCTAHEPCDCAVHLVSFEAKYAGRCGNCLERIAIGDRVHYVDDALSHVDCDAEPEPRPTKFQGSSLEDMGF